ncbi:MAG: NotI family restriction endonuclease [Chlorobium sp.]
MFINKDLLDFFGSMTEIKKRKRDVFNALAADVDDPEIKGVLQEISKSEQQHVDQLQQSMNLVNGRPYAYSRQLAAPKPSPGFSTFQTSNERPITAQQPAEAEMVENGYAQKPTSDGMPDVPENPFKIDVVLDKLPIPDDVVPAEDGDAPSNQLQPTSFEPSIFKAAEVEQREENIGAAKPARQNSIGLPGQSLSVKSISRSLTFEKREKFEQILNPIGTIKKAQQTDYITLFQPTLPQKQNSMNTFSHPLAEVFGFTTTDPSSKANRYRSHRHCPFNNKVPNCTKEQTKNPLGVCSIFYEDRPVITCPIRFREDWLITDDAASFFFKEGVRWSSLTEVKLTDAYGKSAGDIDVVLVAYDENGKMVDFGVIEIQAAFISGDVRDPFEFYMKNPKGHSLMDWTTQSNYPQPDFVSATRESLVPQLIFKGSILNSWNKKMAVAINRSYFDTLPNLVTVQKEDAEMAWLIYDLELVSEGDKERYQLRKSDVVYTKFQPTLAALTASYPDEVEHFMKLLPELADK